MFSLRFLSSCLLVKYLMSSSCYAAPSKAGVTCYFCNNEPNSSGSHDQEYDPDCNQDNYDGRIITIDGTTSCYTHVFDDGIVYRGIDHGGHSDGECDITETHSKCYCASDNCNSNLCTSCFGTTPEPSIITTAETIPPISTTIDITTDLPTDLTTDQGTTTAIFTTEPTTIPEGPTTGPVTTDEPTTIPEEPTTGPVTTAEPTTISEQPTTGPVTTDEPTTIPEEPTTGPVTTDEPTTIPEQPTTGPMTTDEPTTIPEQPTTGPSGLACYSCDDCATVDENTDVVQNENLNSCFYATFDHNDKTERGGTEEIHMDGECRHYAGKMECFCTAPLCNDI